MTVAYDRPPTIEAHPLGSLPVAIIGAGPIGLAAAAQLVERGIDFVILEAGDAAASSVSDWGTSASSPRGGTSSTPRREGCSRVMVGPLPATRTSRRRVQNSSLVTSRHSPPWSRLPHASDSGCPSTT